MSTRSPAASTRASTVHRRARRAPTRASPKTTSRSSQPVSGSIGFARAHARRWRARCPSAQVTPRRCGHSSRLPRRRLAPARRSASDTRSTTSIAASARGSAAPASGPARRCSRRSTVASQVSAGYVGILSVELHFPEASSLKGKRKYVKSAKAQLQNRFGASVAEVDHHELWQRARLTIACVARAHHDLDDLLDDAERYLAGQDFELVRAEREVVTLD